MRVLDLCSGIGGFSLGLTRAGMRTTAFCEIEEYPRSKLRKNWPTVPIFEDLKNLTVDMDGNLLYVEENGNVLTATIGANMPAKRNDKYDEAKNLYEKGLSIADCADFYGITRQAMHQILQRRGVTFRPQHKFKQDNHFFRGGQTEGRRRAGHAMEAAIKKGIIERQIICEECHATKTFSDGRTGIQAHHDDYNKPLDVRWLCQECHHEWHKENKPKGGAKESTQKNEKIDVICAGFP